MKKILTIYALILAFTMLFAGCADNSAQNAAPTSTPTPTPTLDVAEVAPYNFESVIEVDSEIVGQWVPVGVAEKENNGYMQFTADGNLVRFSIGKNGEMNYEELRYYLTGENTFCMIRSDNAISAEFRFEVVDDGKTLNIYNTPSLNIPSKFERID